MTNRPPRRPRLRLRLRPCLTRLEVRALLSTGAVDDFPNDVADAATIELSPAGAAVQAGCVENGDDIDLFRFVSPVSGRIAVLMSAATGSELDSFLTRRDEQGGSLGSSDDEGGGPSGLDSLLLFDVTAGDTYFIQAEGATTLTTGEYVLIITIDDYRNDPRRPSDIAISSGASRLPGRLEYPGDVDVVRFHATTSGNLTVRNVAAPGGAAGVVTTLGYSLGAPLASTAPAPGAGVAALTGFHIFAGQTYNFLTTSRDLAATGSYDLAITFQPDDFGDDLATADDLTAFDGRAERRGALGHPGDVDVFRFRALSAATVAVEFAASTGGGPVPALAVLDDASHRIDPTSPAPGVGSGSVRRLTLAVEAGRTYVFRVAAAPGLGLGDPAVSSPYTLRLAQTGDEVEPNDSPDDAQLVAPGLTLTGAIAPDDPDVYRIEPPVNGRLVARVRAGEATLRLSLLDATGRLLVQSDGPAAGDGGEVRLDVHVDPGPLFLRVESRNGESSYTLTTTFTPSPTPFPFFGEVREFGFESVVLADFNGDGVTDLATSDGIHLGNDDGTFRAPLPGGTISTDLRNDAVGSLVSGDFDGDGFLDLIGSFFRSDRVAFMPGAGDGTFLRSVPDLFGVRISGLVAGDFNGDHRLDLAGREGREGSGGISVYPGNGDGTFGAPAVVPSGPSEFIRALGDFNGDGHADFVTFDASARGLVAIAGNGDGTFRAPVASAIVPADFEDEVAFASGDFDGDGRLDLSVSSFLANRTLIALGQGDGTFRPGNVLNSGFRPGAALARDFNDDGRLDLAVLNLSEVSVLLGDGDGTFQPRVSSGAVLDPRAFAAGDFDGDGRLDLAIVADSDTPLLILPGKGDGSFQGGTAAGQGPRAVAPGDFNGDGIPDLAIANIQSDDVSILLGNGDGAFQARRDFAVGDTPFSVVVADFNGDGRLDLAVANIRDSDVSVLLGNGDGAFQAQTRYRAGRNSRSLVVGDFNGDGVPDLADAVGDDDAVAVLLGQGDGTFGTAVQFRAGRFPEKVVAADFDGDGFLDLATSDSDATRADQADRVTSISVLFGRGDGTFQAAVPYAASTSPDSIVAGDVDGDGDIDLAVADFEDDDVAIYRNNGDGTFQEPRAFFAVGETPQGMTSGDLNGDGFLDLITADYEVRGGADVAVLLGIGDGNFRDRVLYHIPGGPVAVATADFNRDGRLDIVSGNLNSNDLTVLLGVDDGTPSGTFLSPGVLATAPRVRPQLADLDGDGLDDLLVAAANGDILWRRGRPGTPGAFEPPRLVNRDAPTRDFTVVETARGWRVASVDARRGAVAIFAFRDGRFVPEGALPTGTLPAQIAAADLDGDGVADLVVRNAGDDTLTIFAGLGDGPLAQRFVGPLRPSVAGTAFVPALALAVSPGASDLVARDLTGLGPDLLLTTQGSGGLTILRNLGGGDFAPAEVYRAGTGVHAVSVVDDGPVRLVSGEATSGVDLGRLTAGGPATLVAANPGSNTLGLLTVLPGGRIADPVPLRLEGPPGQVRLADVNRDGVSDLIRLGAAGVTVRLGDGLGGFVSQPAPTPIPTPDAAGFSVADADRDGTPDLLVGSSFGDVLVLLGNGDGTFQPFRKTDQRVFLAVADVTGTGRRDFVFADEGRDRVIVRPGGADLTVVDDSDAGVLAPGALALADLDGDGIQDMVVANTGSNNVLVYPGLADGTFGRALNDGHGFFTGTNPSSASVADVNGDGRPDLVVANRGSNDVSVLLNRPRAGAEGGATFVPGPRLRAGVGPTSTAVRDVNGDGLADISVSNSVSNDVWVLPGRGGGFFNDGAPRVFPVGSNPGALIAGNFDGTPGLAVVNRGSNSVTQISGLGGAPVSRTIPTGGTAPVAAFAVSTGGGFDSLVVANNGSGSFALLEGGAGGLTLNPSNVFSDPGLPSPTSLAFAGFDGGTINFFAATEGVDSASALLAFALSGGTVPEPPASAPGNVASLVPLRDSALALVATLLTLTLDSSAGSDASGDASETEALPLAGFLPVATVLIGQGGDARDDGSGGEDLSEDDAGAASAAPASPTLTWERFVIGLDEALEQVRDELRAGLFGPPAAFETIMGEAVDLWFPGPRGLEGAPPEEVALVDASSTPAPPPPDETRAPGLEPAPEPPGPSIPENVRPVVSISLFAATLLVEAGFLSARDRIRRVWGAGRLGDRRARRVAVPADDARQPRLRTPWGHVLGLSPVTRSKTKTAPRSTATPDPLWLA